MVLVSHQNYLDNPSEHSDVGQVEGLAGEPVSTVFVIMTERMMEPVGLFLVCYEHLCTVNTPYGFA